MVRKADLDKVQQQLDEAKAELIEKQEELEVLKGQTGQQTAVMASENAVLKNKVEELQAQVQEQQGKYNIVVKEKETLEASLENQINQLKDKITQQIVS